MLFSDYVNVYNLFNIILLSYGWYKLAQFLTYLNNNSFKLSRMNVSGVHALTVIFFYIFNGSLDLLYFLSLTYYIMDTKYEFDNIFRSTTTINTTTTNTNTTTTITTTKKISLYDFGIIVHHILSMILIAYLLDPSVNGYIFYIYFLAEISNLPMYLAYHLIHINYSNKKIIRWITIAEATAFGFCRMYLGSYMAYEIWFIVDTPMFIIFSSIIMLLISLIWTVKLIVQLKNT